MLNREEVELSEALAQARRIIQGDSDMQKETLKAEKELDEKIEELKRLKSETREILSRL